MGEIAPAKLAIVPVPAGACPHSGVAHQKQNGVGTLAGRPCNRPCRLCKVQRVRRMVLVTVVLYHCLGYAFRGLALLETGSLNPGLPSLLRRSLTLGRIPVGGAVGPSFTGSLGCLGTGLCRAFLNQNGVQEYVHEHVLLLDFLCGEFGAPHCSSHILSKVETGLGRLVVADILVCQACPVGRVFEEGMEAVVSRDGADIQAQFLPVRRAEEHFFPPVSEDVSADARSRLAAVDALCPFEAAKHFNLPAFGIVFLYYIAVQQLPCKVSVPPGGEIHGSAVLLGQYLAPEIAYSARCRGPHLPAGVGRVDVGGHTAAYVYIGRYPVDKLSGACIEQGRAYAFVLVADPDLKLVGARNHGAHVHSVAVTPAGRI